MAFGALIVNACTYTRKRMVERVILKRWFGQEKSIELLAFVYESIQFYAVVICGGGFGNRLVGLKGVYETSWLLKQILPNELYFG